MTIITADTPFPEVVKELKRRAATGSFNALSGFDKMREYQQFCNLGYRPLGCTLTLTRDDLLHNKVWHLSIGFVDEDRHLEFDRDKAEVILQEVFGPQLPNVRRLGAMTSVGQQKHIHHFMLFVANWSDLP